jgi:hypothetical protein
MKLTSLLQLVDNLQQAGKIDKLQQVCGVFGCVSAITIMYVYILEYTRDLYFVKDFVTWRNVFKSKAI